MIQLFEGNAIEVISDHNGGTFVKARDVFKALNLTWKNTKSSILARGIEISEIRRGPNLGPYKEGQKGNISSYISEVAMYQLSFRSNKPEAQKFTRWVADVIKTIRSTGKYEISQSIDLEQHCDHKVQKQNSKDINAKKFSELGREGVIDYNRTNCKLHTGMTTKEVKEVGKKLGLKSKDRQSAKEVLRNVKPELAAGMSFTDRVVINNGADHKEAAQLSKKYAVPLFEEMIKLGVDKNQLID